MTKPRRTVKAIVQDRFGPPERLRLAGIDPPGIGPGEVLIRVHAAALNPYDWHMLRGDPYIARLMGGTGLTRPKSRVAGIDAAGRVEAAGAGVAGLRPGRDVLGFCPGAFAEYARTRADLVVPMPDGLSFEQAAAVPMAATTALRGIRDVGQVQAGQQVLVNGAAGGVGSYAVQIAAALGATVTGVCGPRNQDLVRSLGAAHVVDYTAGDFTGKATRYDLILDNVGNRPLRVLRRLLTPAGTLVLNAGGTPGHLIGAIGPMLRLAAVNPLVRQHLRILPTRKDRALLAAVTALIDEGKLRPVIDRTYPLTDVPLALSRLEEGHTRGKIVITIA
jgi:NADPH:quinone reductase-like Zn-dependent oxidoreductase